MIEKINKAYKNYFYSKNDSVDNYCKLQSDIVGLYLESNKDDSIKNTVLTIVEACLKKESTHHYMWGVRLGDDQDMLKKVKLLQNKVMAKKCLSDFVDKPHPELLKQTVHLAYTCCENQNTQELDMETVSIWKDCFKSVTEFDSLFNQEVDYWKKFREEQTQKYKM